MSITGVARLVKSWAIFSSLECSQGLKFSHVKIMELISWAVRFILKHFFQADVQTVETYLYKGQSEISFPNLTTCTTYSFQVQLKVDNKSIVDENGILLPRLNKTFRTLPDLKLQPLLSVVEQGRDVITVNLTGEKIIVKYTC